MNRPTPKTNESCSTCKNKEKFPLECPCNLCAYNEQYVPDTNMTYWESRDITIKMKNFTQKEAAKIRRYAEWLEQAVNGQTIDLRK